ncbi:MAG: hypothetical protein RBS37_07290 [Bacteroidales bacterium]|jgi:hypothetical protein|nr:hypothetical protein [Bacteroidales bacterium]
MKQYVLTVAGYRIRFLAQEGITDMVPGNRFRNSITIDNGVCDLVVRVFAGSPPERENQVRLFRAPLVEDNGGGPVKRQENFWSVYGHRSGLLIKTVFPRNHEELQGWLMYSLTSAEWDLYITGGTGVVDPFEYPLDGLILYYLTVMNGDIFIHGSAVLHNDRGYLFSGVSGSGKTTMARLWEEAGALVIHDDRVIIRTTAGGFMIHNTPVYDDDEPRSGPLSRILLLSHGTHNELLPLHGANALSRVMANCIQHNWSPELIGQLTGSLYLLTQRIPVAGYWFVPDATAVDFLIASEG